MDPHKHEVSPVVPRDKSAVEDVVAPTLNAVMGEFGEENICLRKQKVSLKRHFSQESEGEISCSHWFTEEKRTKTNLPGAECKEVSIDFIFGLSILNF